MDTWNRMTAVRGVGETGGKKVEAVAKEHTCITKRPRQQYGDGQWEGEGRGMGEGVQRGRGNGDTCHSVNNKNKTKN